MNISYKVADVNQEYKSDDNSASSFLSNQRGDFFLLGNNHKNLSYFGLSYYHAQEGFIKLINCFELENVEQIGCIYEGYKTTNEYHLKHLEPSQRITESYFLGPSGGFVYNLSGYQGRVKINFDIRKIFSTTGASYDVNIENGIIFVEGKLGLDYFYVGINAKNTSYHMIKEFEKRDFKDMGCINIFKLLEFDVADERNIYVGIGLSKLDVMEQLELLEHHQDELMEFDKNISFEILKNVSFEKPIQDDFLLAYKQSLYCYHHLFKRSIDDKVNTFLLSGFPTKGINIFDELLSLRVMINRGSYIEVKNKLKYILNLVDNETGFITLNEDGGNTSLSCIFILAKRFEDLIFNLDEQKKLFEIFTYNELDAIYLKLVSCFTNISRNCWSEDMELIFSTSNDLAIESEEGGFYLESQVGYLNFISVLATFSTILQKANFRYYVDFEQSFREKIIDNFFEGGFLIHKLNEFEISSNVFLSYYYYPNLLTKSDWIRVFNYAIKRLKNKSGFSIYSTFHKFSKSTISLHSNEEIKKEDSLVWLNNLAALVLYDCSSSKFNSTIREILLNSTKCILKEGIVGTCCNANKTNNEYLINNISLNSTATYLELINNLFN